MSKHEVAARVLEPFEYCIILLGPGKSQVKTVGILPNKNSQLARYCLVWGIRPVYGPSTVGQVTKIKDFTGYGLVHRVCFYFFSLSMRCKCLSKNAD